MDPVILASARKHGVLDDDMLHAYRNPIRVFEVDDLVMLVGPDQAGPLLEVGVVVAEGIERSSSMPHASSIQVLEVMTMPRSIQQILDQAEDLAKRFEEYEPQPGDERPVEEYLLQPAVLARVRSERQVVEAVAAARGAGLPWSRVGELLGTSAQAAQQ